MLEVFRSTCRQSLRTETVSVGQLVAIDPDDPAWAPWISGPRPRLVPTGEVVDEGDGVVKQGVEAPTDGTPVELEADPDQGPALRALPADAASTQKPKRTRKANPDAT